MKVLWVTLRIFSDEQEKKTGVWLKALAIRLTELHKIEIVNVSTSSNVEKLTTFDYRSVKQWVIPEKPYSLFGNSSSDLQSSFNQVILYEKPDIIQIWGSENPLGLLPFTLKTDALRLLAIQGVMGSISDRSLLGMNFLDKIACIGLREILTGRSIFSIKKSFSKDAKSEAIMLRNCDYIMVQSNWTFSQICQINPGAKYYWVHRQLRPEFLSLQKKWHECQRKEIVIFSAAVGYSLKGLHILIDALAIVKEKFPNIKLKLAGETGRKDWLGEGYIRFILRKIKKLNLEKSVVWLGPLSAEELISNFQASSVFVNPSFVESYSMILAEAMAVGTPSVISFSGAMPELAENDKEVLFFPQGDYFKLAYNIFSILSNENLALKLSLASQKRSRARNFQYDNALEQLQIYKEILKTRADDSQRN